MMLPDSKYIVKEIKSFGAGLGFNHIGIAPPTLSIWGDRFNYSIRQGFQGEMRYLERDADRRADLHNIFPEVKSVIVISQNYYPGKGRKDTLDNPSTGYIANYALNEEYHPLIESKLRDLLQHINKLTNGKVQGKIYVDTGPVSEKAFAVIAGLGWMGKHTLVVSQDAGSWLLLGVLLINIEFDFDEPVMDQCGNCTRCIEACPTRAIVAPYILDARRCISYLLGELKGPIPIEMRPLIGNRIFGCDDCQWACPWNSPSQVSDEMAFRPREDLTSPVLAGLMETDDDKFSRIFDKNPIKRIKRKKLLRNVAVAIGNSGDKRAIPVLEKLVKDPDTLIREHAEWALRQISGE